ncbi:DUF4123 domain-containing protein [Xenorhabdus szentirmaii]|uniref:DUF4123 domain-containing protein n=3 Tax=Xenorhabdus szentirmaii TaxID=290112 RepID=UPI000C05398A|nr:MULTISPECIES: DUF4123 domain-containing protein [Xenorhabdus]MBD2827039.1 DUF4123 domain-containing protein [Xenorhabdus sp. 5]PHM42185.1 hypothetical protein Xszus_01915 [Xenorhabdus szentirmaii]
MYPHYLQQSLPLENHRYALIDRALFPELEVELPVIEVVSPLLEPQANLYPWLISMHELSAKQWVNLFTHISESIEGKVQPMVSLFFDSELPPEEMKNRLVHGLYIQNESRKGFILRYYDPRVLFHLSWLWDINTFRSQLAVDAIKNWTFYLEGEWHTLSFAEKEPTKIAPANIKINSVHRIGMINQALAKMPSITERNERKNMSIEIENLFQVALEKFKLTHRNDLVAFAVCGVTIHSLFYEHSYFKALLVEGAECREYFSRSLMIVNNYQLEKAKNELLELNDNKLNNF